MKEYHDLMQYGWWVKGEETGEKLPGREGRRKAQAGQAGKVMTGFKRNITGPECTAKAHNVFHTAHVQFCNSVSTSMMKKIVTTFIKYLIVSDQSK
jgi:hypothetical protein